MSDNSAMDVNAAAGIVSALDSPLRIRIILLLAERNHVVHELVDALKKSQPLVSQHLRVLKRSGLVIGQRAGREVSYELARPEIVDILKQVDGLAKDLEPQL